MITASSPWALALRALGEELELHEPAAHVVRAELDRDGGSVWTLEVDGATHWFRHRDGRLVGLAPTGDAQLAGAALMGRHPIVSCRPGRRAVVADAAQGRVWKLLRAKRLVDTVARVRAAAAHVERSGGWRAPSVAAVDAERAAFALPLVPGRAPTLAPGDLRHWREVGRCLRRFVDEPPMGSLPHHGAPDELAHLVGQAELVRGAAGALEESTTMLLERLLHLPPPADARTGAAHRDLHDGQLLVGPDGIWILDLDMFCTAGVALDLGNLIAHLVLRGLQQADPAGAQAASTALLAGFDPPDDIVLHRSLRYYQATTFARLALLYTLRPRWSAAVPALAAHGLAALEDMGHG